MSGLRSSFSRPRITYGATANVKARGFQTPVVSATSDSASVVRENVLFDSRGWHQQHFSHTQSRSNFGPVAGASSPAPEFSPLQRGGQQSIRNQSARRQIFTNAGPQVRDPVPCHTLRARLSLESHKAVKLSTKLPYMKSVDRTGVQFRKRFSGLPGEDWVAHLDMLEIHRANKYQWTARQFYYALQHTLLGKAKETVQALEEELECPVLYSTLPDWFEADMEELRAMIAKRVTYPQLEPRTKLAVLIVWFQRKFQQDTADTAWDNFRFAAQEPNETIEDWGTRIKRLRNKVQKYGITVTWEQYLRKWTVGTKTAYFTAQLREALCPSDYRRDPVVTDAISFEAWYQRFLKRQRERSRDLAAHHRIATIQKLRNKAIAVTGAGRDGNKVGTPPKVEKTPTLDRFRNGPGSALNENKHSRLFRPNGRAGRLPVKAATVEETRTCYNCNQKGHLTKDCPHPRRPRQMRNKNRQAAWRTRLKSFAAEILEMPDQADVDNTVEGYIESLMAHIPEVDDDEAEQTPGAPVETGGDQVENTEDPVAEEGGASGDAPSVVVGSSAALETQEE